jgi:hypothetical protein
VKQYTWKSVIVFGSGASVFLFIAAFALIWIRNDIAKDATRIAELEYRLLKLQDALTALEVKVDDSVQPYVLKNRTEGVLRSPVEGQVIRVRMSDAEAFNTEKWNYLVQLNNKGKEGV